MKYRIIRNGFECLEHCATLRGARSATRHYADGMATILRGRYPGRDVQRDENGAHTAVYLSVYTDADPPALMQREYFTIEGGDL